jgi:hypothetical protein
MSENLTKGAGPINKGDLKAVTEATSAVDSVIAIMDWLQANQTISADVRGIVVLGLEAHRKALEPAIKANVHN